MIDTTRVLLVPGLWNSGPQHWQSLWSAAEPGFRRVEQTDWEAPARADWVAVLEAAVAEAGPQVVIAAHSLGCVTVAHWAAETGLPRTHLSRICAMSIGANRSAEGHR